MARPGGAAFCYMADPAVAAAANGRHHPAVAAWAMPPAAPPGAVFAWATPPPPFALCDAWSGARAPPWSSGCLWASSPWWRARSADGGLPVLGVPAMDAMGRMMEVCMPPPSATPCSTPPRASWTRRPGLALRAAGQRLPLVIVQFLKGVDTGEVPRCASWGPKSTGARRHRSSSFRGRAEKAAVRAVQQRNLAAVPGPPGRPADFGRGVHRLAFERQLVDRTLLAGQCGSPLRRVTRKCLLTGRAPAPWMEGVAASFRPSALLPRPDEAGVTDRKGVGS